jgi:hypothetical protein
VTAYFSATAAACHHRKVRQRVAETLNTAAQLDTV